MSIRTITTTPMAILLGHKGANQDAVYAQLNDERPHVRWAGSVGTGKSTSLRVAATELATQIPDTGNPRMYLFETISVPQTFSGLEQTPGITVISPSGQRSAVDHIWVELTRRGEHAPSPIVIAVDDYFTASPALRDLVETIEADTLPGVHLALASHTLRDLAHGTTQTAKTERFKALVREQICGSTDHGWNKLAALARAEGIGWRAPELRDQRVLKDGIGLEDSEIRFGIWGYLRGLDQVMYYDLLPHPDKYTTVMLGSREPLNSFLPFLSHYPELERGRVPFAAVSGTAEAFKPTTNNLHADPHAI